MRKFPISSQILFWVLITAIPPVGIYLYFQICPVSACGKSVTVESETVYDQVITSMFSDSLHLEVREDIDAEMRQVLIEVKREMPGVCLYLYVDDRPLVQPMITRLKPTGAFSGISTHRFDLPAESLEWEVCYFTISDLFGEHFLFQDSLIFQRGNQ